MEPDIKTVPCREIKIVLKDLQAAIDCKIPYSTNRLEMADAAIELMKDKLDNVLCVIESWDALE